ncbi:hypothetical protein SpAn4DRAFT_1186 [Sporomusa ovata]|uniref:Uncharacterized protein n=1 Tax=Sporomusa ovata TaxID=2378 RepID=A0A0U1KS50_9FIRM|nr:hypothetical protein SpAn4DRAFT_1186 [Sporomusa ovata]
MKIKIEHSGTCQKVSNIYSNRKVKKQGQANFLLRKGRQIFREV